MKALLPLLAAALATLVLSFIWQAPPRSDARLAEGGRPPAVSPIGELGPPRVHCPRPATLRLRRFEDRSARLECAGRVLVRVSVPG